MPRRCLPFVIASVLLAVSTLLGATLRAADAAGEKKALELTIVDGATGKPVAGEVTVNIDGKESMITADAGGRCSVEFPAGARYFSIGKSAPGFVPVRAAWGQGRAEAAPPAKYTLALEPGTKIGGRVIDDAGQPVNGATVMLHIRRKLAEKPAESVDVVYEPVKTDADGKWSYDAAPARYDAISLGAYHLQYSISGFYPMEDFQDASALRAGTATLKLDRGSHVEGVVLDESGKPVAGAKVGVGGDRVASNMTPEFETDEGGRFSFGAKIGEMIVITVKAKGHAPEQQRFVAGKDPKRDLQFHLGPAKTLKGRILDAGGKPIQGVTIYTDTWRNSRTLDTHLETDADGRFVWDGAPADEVRLDIYKAGYADLRGQSATASDQELTLTLRKPLKVSGIVTDAATGERVTAYRIVKGLLLQKGRAPYWERRRGDGDDQILPHPDGMFAYELSYPYQGYAVRIEADGYLPAESRVFKLDERQVELKLELKKGAGLSGIVRTADGKPAIGAKIVVATAEQTAYITNGKDVNEQGNVTATTDAEGRYSMPPQTGTYTLVVLHDAGYAEIPGAQVAKSTDLTIQPWGRVEGTVKVGVRPAAGAELAVHYMDDVSSGENAPRIYHQVEAKSDAEGHFTIPRVKPGGDVWVSKTVRIPMSGSSWMVANAQTAVASIEPGKTARVELGGQGRPVVGRINIPAEVSKRPVWSITMSSLMRDVKFPEFPAPPDDAKTKSPQDLAKWRESFLKSEAGKAYQDARKLAQKENRSYGFMVQPDGSFRIDDVLPGNYTLTIMASEPPPGSLCGSGETIGTASGKLVVPDIAGGRSDKPLEIPTLEMVPRRTVNVGDAAPAFTAKTLDGKDLSLADFKGKYVLLDFWATWCGPCVAETPYLKEAYEAFKGNDRFAMLSLSLDPEMKEPKAFAEKNQIAWPQGFLGEWSQTKVPESYGVQGIPSIWLIGPDGRVIAKNLRGADIKQALQAAMK